MAHTAIPIFILPIALLSPRCAFTHTPLVHCTSHISYVMVAFCLGDVGLWHSVWKWEQTHRKKPAEGQTQGRKGLDAAPRWKGIDGFEVPQQKKILKKNKHNWCNLSNEKNQRQYKKILGFESEQLLKKIRHVGLRNNCFSISPLSWHRLPSYFSFRSPFL